MRNIIFLGAIASMTACGISEDKFGEDSTAEACRILVLCDLYDDEAACLDDTEPADTTGCTFDADNAKTCLSDLKDITECPADLNEAIPSSCGDVWDCDTGAM